MERGAEQAVADGMDVILGGDFVNAYRRTGASAPSFSTGRRTPAHQPAPRPQRGAGRRRRAPQHGPSASSAGLLLQRDSGAGRPGIIVQSNDVACKILEQEREKLVGLPLSTLMPRGGRRVLGRRAGPAAGLYFSVLNVAGVHVVDAAPVADWDAGEGMVFSFYEMQKMERQGERALRERYRLQRYLAHGRFEDVNPPAGRCPAW